AEQLSEEDLEELARQLWQMSPMTQALAQGQAAQLARLLRQATLSIDFRGLQSPLQRGFYARRLLQAAGGGQAEAELRQLLQHIDLDIASRQIDRTLKALEDAARRIAELEQKTRDPE